MPGPDSWSSEPQAVGSIPEVRRPVLGRIPQSRCPDRLATARIGRPRARGRANPLGIARRPRRSGSEHACFPTTPTSRVHYGHEVLYDARSRRPRTRQPSRTRGSGLLAGTRPVPTRPRRVAAAATTLRATRSGKGVARWRPPSDRERATPRVGWSGCDVVVAHPGRDRRPAERRTRTNLAGIECDAPPARR
jgi:hypothetical protein